MDSSSYKTIQAMHGCAKRATSTATATLSAQLIQPLLRKTNGLNQHIVDADIIFRAALKEAIQAKMIRLRVAFGV